MRIAPLCGVLVALGCGPNQAAQQPVANATAPAQAPSPTPSATQAAPDPTPAPPTSPPPSLPAGVHDFSKPINLGLEMNGFVPCRTAVPSLTIRFWNGKVTGTFRWRYDGARTHSQSFPTLTQVGRQKGNPLPHEGNPLPVRDDLSQCVENDRKRPGDCTAKTPACTLAPFSKGRLTLHPRGLPPGTYRFQVSNKTPGLTVSPLPKRAVVVQR